MRSTLTIEQPIDAQLRAFASARAISYKQAVNLALAKGLERLELAEGVVPYEVEVVQAGLRPGIDQTHLNTLADDPDSL